MARRKKQDEDPSQDNPNNSDETFGLPEIEYQPLQRDESSAPESESTSTSESSYQSEESPRQTEREEIIQNEYNTNTSYYDNDDEGGSPWPKILGIAAILLVTAGAIWYFGIYRPRQLEAAQKARQEQEDARKREADLAEQKRLEDERRKADSLAALNAKPAVGAIDTLTERTGRYYVIVASSVDGDLILDYAKKLAPKGVSPRIIPPHGKVKFYRLAIADGDTYASTQATADQLKGQYQDGAWVVKY